MGRCDLVGRSVISLLSQQSKMAKQVIFRPKISGKIGSKFQAIVGTSFQQLRFSKMEETGADLLAGPFVALPLIKSNNFLIHH